MLNKVTDYIIVNARTDHELSDNVKSKMDEGWVPSGPLIVEGLNFYQVLVKFSA